MDAETDTEILRRLYIKKVEERTERAYSELEKTEVWLEIARTVLEEVDGGRGRNECRL
jgi:hypothetical protein